MTKITLAAFVAAMIVSAPAMLAAHNGNAGATVTSRAENVADWCSGPRQHTDYRCFKG
jgi:hypothetical protein